MVFLLESDNWKQSALSRKKSELGLGEKYQDSWIRIPRIPLYMATAIKTNTSLISVDLKWILACRWTRDGRASLSTSALSTTVATLSALSTYNQLLPMLSRGLCWKCGCPSCSEDLLCCYVAGLPLFCWVQVVMVGDVVVLGAWLLVGLVLCALF